MPASPGSRWTRRHGAAPAGMRSTRAPTAGTAPGRALLSIPSRSSVPHWCGLCVGHVDVEGRMVGQLRAAQSSWAAVDLAALVLRLVLGFVFIAHGGQKLFSLFGGTGIDGT